MSDGHAPWCQGFIDGLPQRPGAAREEAIFTAVREGHVAPVSWVEITSEHGGRTAVISVSADALRVGDEEMSIRVNTTARTMQRIVDLFDCVMPTTRICDLIWEQATVRLTPCILRADAEMASTARMVQHHESVERKRAGRAGLTENVGKHWVVTNRLAGAGDRAANYGWYDPSAPRSSGAHRLWQTLGLAHDTAHVDYSQVVRLVRRRCLVDGAERDLLDVMRDPDLAPLVSSEGPLRVVRVWGVP